VSTQIIPLQETVRVALDELEHLTNNLPAFINSEFLMRVAGLSMNLLSIQSVLALHCDPTPPVNELVDTIHRVLEATEVKLSAHMLAQRNVEQNTGSTLH
jgi:hypothetical protein